MSIEIFVAFHFCLYCALMNENARVTKWSIYNASSITILVGRCMAYDLQDGAAKYPLKSTWINMRGPNPLILLSSVFSHLSSAPAILFFGRRILQGAPQLILQKLAPVVSEILGLQEGSGRQEPLPKQAGCHYKVLGPNGYTPSRWHGSIGCNGTTSTCT
jgi:hypothetical protein